MGILSQVDLVTLNNQFLAGGFLKIFNRHIKHLFKVMTLSPKIPQAFGGFGLL